MKRLCLVILVVVYFGLSEAEDDLPFTSPVKKNDRTSYLSFAGKTYYFGTVFSANFHRAMQFCRQQGMQLVSINSQAENDRLGRFAEEIGSRSGRFWTSGTNLANEGQWIWLSTGHNIIYTNWRPGEPSFVNTKKAKENCIEARHYGKGFTWNDLACTAELFFICEVVDNSCNIE